MDLNKLNVVDIARNGMERQDGRLWWRAFVRQDDAGWTARLNAQDEDGTQADLLFAATSREDAMELLRAAQQVMSKCYAINFSAT